MSTPASGMFGLGDSHEGVEQQQQQRLQQRLPFRVGIASREELSAVAQLRAAAYGRHLPELGSRLLQPESADFEWGCEVLVATSKLDGTVLGTLRTHTNVLKPLPLEASMALPAHFAGKRMIEATRLSVRGGAEASLVRNALFKAFYCYAQAQLADELVVAGRKPVDRIYDSLLFSDVAEAGAFYPMTHAGGLLHRVMSLGVTAADALWRRAGHPLYEFVVQTEHEDIDLRGVHDLTLAWGLGRSDAPQPASLGRRLALPQIPLRRAGGLQFSAAG